MIEHIRETIQRSGPVSFAWFMEQALYHPSHGYYSSGRCTIGKRGDYYTSVSVGPLFGRLLAAQFAEMWAALGRPDRFTIVEQGAHDGTFARDVLVAARQHHPDLFGALRYEIVEPFPALRIRQTESLAGFGGKVSWQESLAELPHFVGVHFSNELIDAMPVHLVRWNGTEWTERHVTTSNDNFSFVNLPPSSVRLTEHLRNLPGPLPAGYETEVNLCALEWIATASHKLRRGYLLAADYGFPRDEFYAPQRTAGTLRSYANHRVSASPFAHIGHADITAHVEWSTLAAEAVANDLSITGFADQYHFVTGLLAGKLEQEFGPSSEATKRRALQTLLHPNFLGMNFQFLALSKDVNPPVALSGFRFARDPRIALGLTDKLRRVGKVRSLAKEEGSVKRWGMKLRPKLERLIPRLVRAIGAIEK